MEKKTEQSIFCENIRKLREKENLSPEEMAEKLNISVDDLISIERGILPEALDCVVLFMIHRQFGIVPQALFSENKE